MKEKLYKFCSFLSSSKFAMVISACILILAIAGSLIPKVDTAVASSQLASNIVSVLGLDHIYTSPIFITLIALFALNLILCTLKLIIFDLNKLSDINNHVFKDYGRVAINHAEVLTFLESNNFDIKRRSNIVTASKNPFGKYTVVILHTGILIVLLGALLGYLFGFKGYINILEGSFDNVAVLSTGEFVPLGFDIKVNRFDVKYYDNTSRPSGFVSDITITKESSDNSSDNSSDTIKDNKSLNYILSVNSPLEYEGVSIYQHSYGFYLDRKGARFLFDVEIDNVSKKYEVKFNESFKIKDNLFGKITDFAPALAVSDDGKFSTMSEEMINPAILLEAYSMEGDPVLRSWLLSKQKTSGDFTKDYGFKMTFDKLYGVQYTGLAIKKDPGTAVVYLGFLIISIALILTYLINYTVIFIQFTKDEETGEMIFYKVFKQRKFGRSVPAQMFYKLIDRNEKDI